MSCDRSGGTYTWEACDVWARRYGRSDVYNTEVEEEEEEEEDEEEMKERDM